MKRIIISLFILISFSSCKKECFICSTQCTIFTNFKDKVCLSDFKNASDYIDYVDSLKNIYSIDRFKVEFVSFCEEDKNEYGFMLSDFGWECSFYNK